MIAPVYSWKQPGCALHGGAAKRGCSVENFEAIFFYDGIGEDFARDFFELFLGFVAIPAVEIENEEFALADVGDLSVAETGEGVMNGLALRVENGALGHDPDVCFHGDSIRHLQ